MALSVPWGDEAPKRARLLRMKVVATSLLPVMAVIFALASHFKTQYPALAWLEAFSEAALVGGLADWFAVVALFRHPGGVPLPHTAIIPNNKDRIGTQLGAFVEENFLTPENITAKLADVDLSATVVGWFADEDNALRVVAAARDELPRFANVVDEPEIERAIARVVSGEIERLDLARLSARILALLTRDGRHQRLLDDLLPVVTRVLDDRRRDIKRRFGQRSALTPVWMDSFIVDRFVDGIIDLIAEVERTPDHEMRIAFDAAVKGFVSRLKSDPDIALRLEDIRASLLRGRAVDTAVASAWDAIKARLAAPPAGRERESDAWVARVLAKIAREIMADRPLLDRLNRNVLDAIEAGLGRFQNQFASLIEEIVRKWDTRQVTDKVELELGPDLQFIRLNGTFIGGLVGVALHALQAFAGVRV
jgi:uncharacterized membrane-anchored protein YjiN (DUF445 family)